MEEHVHTLGEVKDVTPQWQCSSPWLLAKLSGLLVMEELHHLDVKRAGSLTQ